jgi:hypothetical protein
MNNGCNQNDVLDYIADTMELEEKLEFLLHVDSCNRCRYEIHQLIKAQHPHFYKPAASSKNARRKHAQLEEVA